MQKKSISKSTVKFLSFFRFRRLPLLISLTRRAVIFFICTLVSLVFLYTMGSYQSFLDSNLNLILVIFCFTSIGMAIFCLAGVIECIYYFFIKKRPHLLFHMIIFLLLFVGAAITAILTDSIFLLTEGI